MNYKLRVFPVFDAVSTYLELEFETIETMRAASSACADLLLFLQCDIEVMPDYSNVFIMMELVDGEWEDIG